MKKDDWNHHIMGIADSLYSLVIHNSTPSPFYTIHENFIANVWPCIPVYQEGDIPHLEYEPCVWFLHLKKDYVQDLIKQVEQCY